jgi:hypothetical protein
MMGPYLIICSLGLKPNIRIENADTFSDAWAIREAEIQSGYEVVIARVVETRTVEVEPRHAPVVGGVRGERLRELIEDVAAKTMSDGEPVHYRTIMAKVEATGVQIGGKNPSATFLTHLTRVRTIESVGKRSGLYRRKETV